MARHYYFIKQKFYNMLVNQGVYTIYNYPTLNEEKSHYNIRLSMENFEWRADPFTVNDLHSVSARVCGACVNENAITVMRARVFWLRHKWNRAGFFFFFVSSQSQLSCIHGKQVTLYNAIINSKSSPNHLRATRRAHYDPLNLNDQWRTAVSFSNFHDFFDCIGHWPPWESFAVYLFWWTHHATESGFASFRDRTHNSCHCL